MVLTVISCQKANMVAGMAETLRSQSIICYANNLFRSEPLKSLTHCCLKCFYVIKEN